MKKIMANSDSKTFLYYVVLQVLIRIGLIIIILMRLPRHSTFLAYSFMTITAFLVLDTYLMLPKFFDNYDFENDTVKKNKTLKFSKSKIKSIFMFILKSLLLAFCFILIEALIFSFNNQSSSNTKTINEVIGIDWLFILVPLFLAPIAEESVFRVSLNNLFFVKFNSVFSCIFNSAIFAAFHFISDGQFLIYFLMGCYMQLIYNKWKDLNLNICIHILINSIPVLAMVITKLT